MKRSYKITMIAAAGVAAVAFGLSATAGSDPHREARHAERLDRMFEKLDANADGAIEMSEIEAGRAARFAAIDTDDNGVLSAAEIKSAAAERAEKRASRMLKRLDANGDGTVDQAEYDTASNDRVDRHGAKLFKRFDADGDGRVTRAEAEAHVAKWHKKHDK